MSLTTDVYLLDCDTYQDYLDLFITRRDLKFLGNIRYSRMLVELGYRSTSEVLTPEQYAYRKKNAFEIMHPIKKSLILFHDGINLTDRFLFELGEREKLNYQKIVSTIIFLSYRLKSGFEISGYIDFEHNLKKSNMKTDDATDWRAVFQMKKMLRPKPTDLSYYNSRLHITLHNDTANYVVLHDHDHGLGFMHKGDRKKIFMNQPNELAGRTMVYSSIYGIVALYDHLIRRKL